MSTSVIAPTPTPAMVHHWDSVVAQIVSNPNLPLFVRQRGGKGRGSVVQHVSGRELVIVDNALANFFYSAALHGHSWTVQQVMAMLSAGQAPVAMMFTRAELLQARYTGRQRVKMTPPNLNTLGWQVNHIEPIGLYASRADLRIVPINDLERHTTLQLSVSNMVLSPLH